MDLKKHLEKGWQTTLNFLGPVLLVTVVQLLVSVLSLGIMAPVTWAGYTQSMLLALREGRTPEIKDLFSEMSLFLPLFLFGILLLLAVSLGFVLLVLPGVGVVLFSLFACLYMIPLMTDKKMDLREAVKKSWNMAIQDPMSDHLIILIVYIAIMAIGNSVPFLILAAQPLATFVLLSFYFERVDGGRKILDERNQEGEER